MHRFAVLLSCLAVLGASGRAGAAALSGALRAPDGAGLPQIVLTLRGPSGALTLVTGPEGRFRSPDLAPGEYGVSVAVPGFLLTPEPRVALGATDAVLELVLAPAPVREQVVVAAARQDAALSTLGVSASALDRERIQERQASALLPLFQELPGVATARAGGVGLQASTFVRGGESRFARILIDGVPVNQPGGAFDFGSALPLELERIEVVRGAASSLYGTDALAGVIQLVTRRAQPGEAPGVHAEAEGGGFAWKRALGGTSGRSGRADWNAGLQRLETDNEQPNSAFEGTAGAVSGGVGLAERSSLRLVLRAEDSTTGTPGPTAYGRPDLDASFERTDVTTGLSWQLPGDRLTHALHAGMAYTDQLSLNPLDSGPYLPSNGDQTGALRSDFPDPEGFQNRSRRLSLGYRLEAQAGSRHLLSVGLEMERESGELGSRSGELLAPERTNAGAYVQDRLLLGGSAYLALGARVEHNGSFGTRVVPRAALAYRLRGGAESTTLKASAGAGIKEPDFFQSYGVSFFAQGNPDLEPERSRTVDVGVEQRLIGSRLRVEASAFHHVYLDQIAFQTVDFTTYQGTYVNLEKTRARGLELALEAAPVDRVQIAASYTLLDGEILASSRDFDPVFAAGQPLLRRPRHQGSLSLRTSGERWRAGATLVAVGRRADSDFVGLGLTQNEGYARLDLRAQARLLGGLELLLAAENVTDRRYQEVLGYPALGRCVRAGLRFSSGSRR